MRDYKNIDRIFQEKLKDFEVFPPNKSWDFIEKGLVVAPKKRRLSFWLRISSIAALFVLLFSVGTIYLLPDSNFSKNFLFNDNVKEASETILTTVQKESATVKPKKSVLIESGLKENNRTIADINRELASELQASERTESNEVSNKQTNSNYLTENEVEHTSKKGKKPSISTIRNNKFTVATIYAPIYINSFGDGSGVDSQFKNNPTSGNSSSYSYGVKFAYEINNKFSIQSGVNMINLGYTTNDVYINSGVAVVGFSNITSQPVYARPDNVPSKASSINLFESNKGNLNQVFGYVEIPVELKYSVTDGRFGVNLVGGFSTLLLNRDEVFIETTDYYQSLGSSNNLRSVNFRGNIGVDIDYLIHKNLYINVSPMFKMQTNTFSKNSGSIVPYYLGVYTGLNYKF